jgi:hypothetical protein
MKCLLIKLIYIPAAGGMDFRLMSVLSVVRYRFLGRADHTYWRVILCVCVCVCVCGVWGGYWMCASFSVISCMNDPVNLYWTCTRCQIKKQLTINQRFRKGKSTYINVRSVIIEGDWGGTFVSLAFWIRAFGTNKLSY